jgi:hypothetical protein
MSPPEPPPLFLRPAIRLFEQTPGVQAVWLFGSRARGDARPDSDVDLAILTEPMAQTDAARLRLVWQREVTLALGLPDGSVDLVMLRHAPLPLVYGVWREGLLLIDRDPDARAHFELSPVCRGGERWTRR